MSMYPTFKSNCYEDGCTVESFKDSTDVNRILERHGGLKSINHLEVYGGEYGDFTQWEDLLTAQQQLARGKQIFDDLPTELRREFQNEPSRFFKFVNQADMAGKLHEVFPALAKPGNQVPAVQGMLANKVAKQNPNPPEADVSEAKPEPTGSPD